MKKNRKKKLRNISVKGVNYKWLFEAYKYPEYGKYEGRLKVWHGNDQIIFEEYIGDEPMTPSYVSEAIRDAVGLAS